MPRLGLKLHGMNMIDADPDEIRQAAIKFEAQKMKMSQDKDGWLIVLRIHPNDVQSGDIAELLIDPPGSRYMMGAVRIGDNEQPQISPAQLESKRLVQSAALLCKNIRFQQWLFRSGMIETPDEDDAAEYIRITLGLKSRGDLKDASEHVKQRFRDIRDQFERIDMGKR